MWRNHESHPSKLHVKNRWSSTSIHSISISISYHSWCINLVFCITVFWTCKIMCHDVITDVIYPTSAKPSWYIELVPFTNRTILDIVFSFNKCPVHSAKPSIRGLCLLPIHEVVWAPGSWICRYSTYYLHVSHMHHHNTQRYGQLVNCAQLTQSCLHMPPQIYACIGIASNFWLVIRVGLCGQRTW